MKRILTVAALACVATITNAQNPQAITLEGTVRDSLTRSPEPYATIRVMTEGATKPLRAVAADANGHFRLTLPKAGTYRVECIVIGKQTLRRTVQVDSQTSVTLDDFLLQEISNTLATATVTAERPLVKAEVDKVSYSMADDPEAQTNTLLEMLRKVPMVTVEGDDEIKVKGSKGFKVYVNGKPNQMMSANPSLIFKSYPASAVKKIEVITDPGAKYDAEGVAGILNIVTAEKVSTKGYTLTPTLGYNNRGGHAGLFAMAQLDKLTFSVNYNVGQHNQPDFSMFTERESFNDPQNHLFRSEGSAFDVKSIWQQGSLEASYEFNPKNLLSVSAGIRAYSNDFNFKGDDTMYRQDGTKVYAYNRLQQEEMTYPSYSFGADYQRSFNKENQFLTFSYRLESSPSSTTNHSYYHWEQDLAPTFSLTDLYSDMDQKFAEHTGQVDFTTPIAKHHTLSIGAKYIYRQNRSDNVEMERPAGTTDDFAPNASSLRYRHTTDIAAGYAEYELKVDKFNARAGARYEYSKVHVSYPDLSRPSFSSNFSDLVPNVILGYNISDLQMLKASYNMRIGRPGISYLTPYVDKSNPQSITYGDPNLDSEHRHNMALTYSHFSTKFSVNASLGYSVSNDGLVDYSFIKDGVLHNTYGNILHSKELSLNLYGNWTIAKGLSLYINGSGSYGDLKCYRTGDHNYGWQGSLWGNLRYNLPWRLRMGLSGGGNSKSFDLQGTSKGMWFYSAQLTRTFLKEDRLSITLSAARFIKPHMTVREETLTESFRNTNVYRVNTLHYGISVSYRLGSLKSAVKKAQRSIENNDVVGGKSSESSLPGNQ